MPGRKILKMVNEAAAAVERALSDVPTMQPGKRDVFVADVVCAIAEKLQARFGHDSTIWGLNAAAERLRMANDKKRLAMRRRASQEG